MGYRFVEFGIALVCALAVLAAGRRVARPVVAVNQAVVVEVEGRGSMGHGGHSVSVAMMLFTQPG